jgi:hypothetical protein
MCFACLQNLHQKIYKTVRSEVISAQQLVMPEPSTPEAAEETDYYSGQFITVKTEISPEEPKTPEHVDAYEDNFLSHGQKRPIEEVVGGQIDHSLHQDKKPRTDLI